MVALGLQRELEEEEEEAEKEMEEEVEEETARVQRNSETRHSRITITLLGTKRKRG